MHGIMIIEHVYPEPNFPLLVMISLIVFSCVPDSSFLTMSSSETASSMLEVVSKVEGELHQK